MKERPILFSAPMVRAILAGEKTQTRRIVAIDDKPISARAADKGKRQRGIPTNAVNVRFLGPYLKCDAPVGSATVSARVECPYGDIGDRLWVRETWRTWDERCVDRDVEDSHVCSPHCRQTYVAYAATPRKGFRPEPDRAAITYLDDSTPIERNPRLMGPWRPSIFMPRAASRITLDIVSVRVERLQDITQADARMEGVATADGTPFGASWDGHLDGVLCGPRVRFAELWDTINGKRATWVSNPWVWVIGLKRAEVNHG